MPIMSSLGALTYTKFNIGFPQYFAMVALNTQILENIEAIDQDYMLLKFVLPTSNYRGITKIPQGPIESQWSDTITQYGSLSGAYPSFNDFTYTKTYNKIYGVGTVLYQTSPSRTRGEIFILDSNNGSVKKSWYNLPVTFPSVNSFRGPLYTVTGTGTDYYIGGITTEQVSAAQRGFLASLNGDAESGIFTYAQYFSAGAIFPQVTSVVDMAIDSSNIIYCSAELIVSGVSTGFLIKHNGASQVWAYKFNTPTNDNITFIVVGDNDNIYYISNDSTNCYLVKVDPSGAAPTVTWAKTVLKSTGVSIGRVITDGNVVIISGSYNSSSSYFAFFDTSGNLLREYTIEHATKEVNLNVSTIIGNAFYLTGYYDSFPTNAKGMMMRMPKDGTIPSSSFVVNGETFTITSRNITYSTAIVTPSSISTSWAALANPTLTTSSIVMNNTAYIDNNTSVSI